MSLHLVNPANDQPESVDENAFVATPACSWRRRLGDIATIALMAGGFLASTYLMTLGLPLLFFLLLSGGSLELFFAQLANLADRFLAAEPARQAHFAGDLVVSLIALATLTLALRLPRFLGAVSDALREEMP